MAVSTRIKWPHGFTRWLLKQKERNDPIGDLAKDADCDPTWPAKSDDYGYMLNYLRGVGACDGAIQSFDKAWQEYAGISPIQELEKIEIKQERREMVGDRNLWGQFYFGILVDTSISLDGEIYLEADEVQISQTGDLIFIGGKEPKRPGLIIPSGKWNMVFAASVLDGYPVAIDHWKEPGNKQLANLTRKTERSKMTQKLRIQVLERDEFRCAICGSGNGDGAKLEVDHIIPVSKGGKTCLDNLQSLCQDCNRGKRDRVLSGNGHE